MLSSTSRGLRLSLAAGLVLGALALAPTNASAQWTSDVCVDASDVPSMFFGNFAGLDHCEALCKKAADYCDKFVKDATSCEKTNAKGYYYFIEKEDCDPIVDDSDRKDCKQSVKQGKKFIDDSIDDDKSDALMGCSDYQSACIMNCSAPL